MNDDCIPIYQVSLLTKETTFTKTQTLQVWVDSVPGLGKLCKSLSQLTIQVISISQRPESADCHNDTPDIPHSHSCPQETFTDIFHN